MREPVLRLAGIAGAALLVAACAARDGYRTEVGPPCIRTVGADCTKHSIERAVSETFEDTDAEGKLERYGPYDYLLGFVEYDDHGAPVRPEQLRLLLDTIEAEEGDLAIVVYVHGWKHNAADTDRDVQEFRWLLRGLSDVERGPEGRKRKVVGIYAGWRGSSLTPEIDHIPVVRAIAKPPKQLTFWTRKNAAHRVAKGSIRDLFAAVRDVQARRNGSGAAPALARCTGDTRLVLIGHSFGGLIVYDALHQHLVESARAGLARGADASVPAYGNVVVLLNPALEGVAYASIQDLVQNRTAYANGQPPVLVTFQSENDWATGKAFPFGRFVSTRFERTRTEQQAAENLRAVGHVERFWTHRLALAPDAVPAPRRVASAPSAEPPPPRDLSPERRRERQSQSEQALESLNAERSPTSGRLPDKWKLKFLDERVILSHENLAPDNPFWVVSTDPKILNGHSEIWNDDFLATLNQLYAHFVRPPASACAPPGQARRGPA